MHTAPSPAIATTIFLVHGRDHGARDTVARYLECICADARVVTLGEQPGRAHTTIERFEAMASRAALAVVLATGDDIGALVGDAPRPRARQNVILELGWFMGRLGREHLLVLHQPGVELPTDIDGVSWIPFTDDNTWRLALLQELADAGFALDLQHIR